MNKFHPCYGAQRCGGWRCLLDPRMRRVLLTRTRLGLISAATAACLATPIHAQTATLNGVVGLTSQLVDRGIAITPATPTLQGAVSWTSAAGWSLGLSGGTEVRSPDGVVEMLAQAARNWPLSDDWQTQAALLYYRYEGRAHATTYDHWEAGVHWIYRDTLTLGVSLVRVIGANDHRLRAATDLDFHWPLTRHVSLSLGAGMAQSLVVRPGPDLGGDPESDAQEYPSYYGHRSAYRYGDAGLIWRDGPWLVKLDRIMTDLGKRRQPGSPGTAPWLVMVSRSL